MVIYNGIFQWEGLGAAFGLARGKIRLWIFNLARAESVEVIPLRPYIVVVSDIPGEKITVRGWAGPLAGFIAKKFDLNRRRLVWIEYYPPVDYGQKKAKHIPETFDVVDFSWKGETAVMPRWRPLQEPLLGITRELIHNHSTLPGDPVIE
ncbi:MAG: hypothetical protein R6U29_05275 [Desulfosudaceae bacterium]